MDALKLALAASLAFTAGCPLFDDEPEEEYDYCSTAFDVSATSELVLDVDTPPVTWQVEATFTGVGHDPGDYYGQFFDLRADAVAVSNDPDVDSVTVVVTVGEVGAAQPWISAANLLTVGDPSMLLSVDESLAGHLEDACAGMETCTLQLEVRVEALAPAVVVFHELTAQLRSSMNTSRYEGCGISDFTVEGGPAPAADTDGGAGESGSGSTG